MKSFWACALVLFTALLAASVEAARACSCIPPDPWVALAQGDAVFVGTVLERRESGGEAVLVLSVERRLKGPLGTRVEVTTSPSGSTCGVEAGIGTRVGLALDRRAGAWHGYLCWQFEPAQLLVVAALPPPTGGGAAALFVGGRFGPARSLALDRNGRTLAYGIGAGRAEAFSACPRGRRMAELVAAQGGLLVAVRELPGLRLIWQRRLNRLSGVTVGTLHCLDATGERLGLFASNESAEGRLVRITPAGARTVWRGGAFYTSFRERNAYVQVLRDGTTIVAVDVDTGKARKLGSVRVNGAYQLVLNRSGTRLAGDSFTEGVGNPRLLVIELARRPIALRSIPLPTEFGSMRWLGNDRPVYFGGRGEILVYDAGLRLLSRASGWRGGAPAIVGKRAFGIDGRGRLVSAQLPHGAQRVVRPLPGSFRPNEFRVVAAAGG